MRLSTLGVAILMTLLGAAGCGPGYSDFEKSLGGKFTYFSGGSLDKYILKGSQVAVGNLVASYDYDADWVIVLRVVAEEMECQPGPTADYYFTGGQEHWIINKSSDEILGPFSEEEFSTRRSRLGIPVSLQIDESEAGRAIAYADGFRTESGGRVRNCVRAQDER